MIRLSAQRQQWVETERRLLAQQEQLTAERLRLAEERQRLMAMIGRQTSAAPARADAPTGAARPPRLQRLRLDLERYHPGVPYAFTGGVAGALVVNALALAEARPPAELATASAPAVTARAADLRRDVASLLARLARGVDDGLVGIPQPVMDV